MQLEQGPEVMAGRVMVVQLVQPLGGPSKRVSRAVSATSQRGLIWMVCAWVAGKVMFSSVMQWGKMWETAQECAVKLIPLWLEAGGVFAGT
ncbi:hypothetical protein [Deinococcus misasensis]|uniref:hypothetical protein n=1 Tax=Deinococcus misasensis TaxID=392413 RepID=UPI0012F86922|nr:hypothetical protein [Deinococcus misasensis]